MSNVADEWKGLLTPGEEIVWQGRPSSGLRIEFRSPFEPLFFLFFTGFSIFWMVGASAAGGWFWTFGLLFFFVGSYNLIGAHFWKAYVRSRTHYTLTNKRAFIATDVLGHRNLSNYPISAHTTLSFKEGKLASIYFAEKTSGIGDQRQTFKVGFEQIKDARDVYALMLSAQENSK